MLTVLRLDEIKPLIDIPRLILEIEAGLVLARILAGAESGREVFWDRQR